MLYRDIKGANLLVDASGVVKLTDFGMAKHVSSESTLNTLFGSIANSVLFSLWGFCLFLLLHSSQDYHMNCP